jgi:hypothetical protein
MKCIFWNVRGLANSPTKLALKRLIVTYKPDFCIIAEPWMYFDKFPKTWLSRLNLKLFAVNNRNNLLPNLWCFCSSHLSPTIVDLDDQQISFTFLFEGKTFGISTVYASTSYIKRRDLWCSLSNVHSQYPLPWSFIGDFNTIIGSHEHRGSYVPPR